MTYHELVAKVKEATAKAKVSKTVGHVAYQFNVEGEAEGAFYLELSDGKIYVEPYEYYDRDIIIVTSADVIMQMAEGKLQPMAAYVNGQLKVYGDVAQLNVLPFGDGCKAPSKAQASKMSKKQSPEK
ncbi:MAG: SCP2 sterol-binding domain-containing protein [Roseburia sp.]